jgi:hypothetical protein
MRTLALVLLAIVVAYTPARAETGIDCKSCPIENKTCRQAHSRQVCSSEFAMCLKHCKKT